MDADSFVKIILSISVGFSLLMISFQIARVFGGVADVIKDLRRAVQNIGIASDMLLEDYEQLRSALKNITDIIAGVSSIFGPLAALVRFVKSRKGDKETDMVE